MCLQGFNANSGTTRGLLLTAISTWPRRTVWVFYDIRSANKQDELTPTASLHASLHPLHQRRRHLPRRQGCGVLPPPSPRPKTSRLSANSSPTAASPLPSSVPQSSSMRLTDAGLPKTRAADRRPGPASALATVGTGGNMEGVMEGGN